MTTFASRRLVISQTGSGRCLKARAATPAGLSRLRRLRASISSLSRINCTADADGDGAQLSKAAAIAIAVIAISYFAAAFVSAAGQF